MTNHTSRTLARSAKWLAAVWLLVTILAAVYAPVSAQQPVGGWSTPQDMTLDSDAEHGAFPAFLLDPYDGVHLYWSGWMDNQNDQALYYQTQENGTWTVPQPVVAPQTSVYQPGVVIDHADTVHLIWLSKYIRGDLSYTRAPLRDLKDPRAYTRVVPLAESVDGAAIALHPSGEIWIIYGQTSDDGRLHSLRRITSVDGGTTWSQPESLFHSTTRLPSTITGNLVFDHSGRAHIGISQRSFTYGLYREIGYLRSGDGGTSWDPYRLFGVLIAAEFDSDPGMTGLHAYPFGDDEVHLTWHDPRRMHCWSYDGGQTWSEPEEIMALGAGFGGQNGLVQDSAGTIYAVLGVGCGVYCVPYERGRWGHPEQIESNCYDPHEQEIAVSHGNRLHIVYDDRKGPEHVWYAQTTVNAPALPPITPRPSPEPQVGPSDTPRVDASGSDRADTGETDGSTGALPEIQAIRGAMLYGIAVSAIAVSVVLVVTRLMRRR